MDNPPRRLPEWRASYTHTPTKTRSGGKLEEPFQSFTPLAAPEAIPGGLWRELEPELAELLPSESELFNRSIRNPDRLEE